MQFKDIIYEVKDDYAHVTINRPKVLNAFTPGVKAFKTLGLLIVTCA